MPVTTALLVSCLPWLADIPVANAAELEAAFASAAPGDVITVAPGTYSLSGAVWTGQDGTEAAPITVTTSGVGDARFVVDGVEGIVVAHAWWVLDRIWLDGGCVPIEDCDAGLHVKPTAHHLVVRYSRFTNFRQHIKGSRVGATEVEDVLVLGNELYNEAYLDGGSTTIDVVGGKRWHIVGNYVHDYGGDPNGDYGIFLKGVTSDGIIERNLVVCARDLPPSGATVGISFGGGGTGDEFCPNMDCSCEDFGSIARNNLVLHCTDAGLHTKRACGSKFYANTVYDTGAGLQIQIDGAGDPVDVRGNVMSHHLTGASNVTQSDNAFDVAPGVFAQAYADPDGNDFAGGADPSALADLGPALAEVTDDYCGAPRDDGAPDLGAVEFPGCATWPWSPPDEVPGGDDGGSDDGGDTTGGSPSDGSGDGDGTGVATGAGLDGGGTSDDETSDTMATGASDSHADDDASGCACAATSPRDRRWPGGWLFAFAAIAVARRRSRSRRARGDGDLDARPRIRDGRRRPADGPVSVSAARGWHHGPTALFSGSRREVVVGHRGVGARRRVGGVRR